MEVIVSVKGEKDIQKRFGRVSRNLSEQRAVFAEIAEALAKSNERSYGRGVTLSDETIATKQRKGLPEEPLVATGRLKASLTDLEAPGAVREITNEGLVFGTSVYYAHFLQYSTSKMPAHRVMKFTPTTRKLVKKLVQQHIFKQ